MGLFKKWSLLICLLLITTLSCKSDLKHGEESLEGIWTVTKIISTYGERTNQGISSSFSVEEEGDLGTFAFEATTFEFDYTRQDTLYSDQGNWTLSVEKVNAGFNKVPVYTLETDNTNFLADFEDGTSDATKKAKEIQLTNETLQTGPFTAVQLFLSKN